MTKLVNLTDYTKAYQGKDGLMHPAGGLYLEVHRYDAESGEIKSGYVRIKPYYDKSAKDYESLRSEAIRQVNGSKEEFIEQFPNNNPFTSKNSKQAK